MIGKISLSKCIAEQITDSFAKKQGVNKDLVAKRNDELMQGAQASSLISRHEFISPDAEFSWVAKEIRKLIETGTSPNEIAILAPRHRLILPIIPYLKAENINIAYEKRENILEDARIRQLLTLAEFIYELANEKNPTHRLLEIMSFSFWNLPSLEIITTLHQAKASPRLKTASVLQQLASSASPNIQKIATFLADLVTTAFSAPLELFLDYLIGTAELNNFQSPYLDYYNKSADYTTFELYNNLSVLREAIRTHTHAPQPTLKELVTFIRDYREAEAAVQNTSPYQDASNSVQVMTAHKSKGLEFKHVFLTSLDDNSWGNATGNRNLIVLPKNLTHLRHTGDTENECLRLLFVAITRAELSLTMTNSIKSFTESTLPRLEYLDEHEDDEHRPVSPHLPEPYIITHYDDLEQTKLQANLAPHWISAYQETLPELRPILEKKLENYQLTASDLTSFIDLRYAGPANFYQTRILGAPRDPITPEIRLGNLIHATFEAVTTEKLDNAEALKFFEEKLMLEPVTEAEAELLLEKGRRALEVSLADFGELLRDEHGKAEVDLRHEHLVLAEETRGLAGGSAGAARIWGIGAEETSSVGAKGTGAKGAIAGVKGIGAEGASAGAKSIGAKGVSSAGVRSIGAEGVSAGAEATVPRIGTGARMGALSVGSNSLAGVPLTGKIDHIHIGPQAKTIEIYDFKTGKFHPKGWTSHDSLYRYSLQLGFYKLLLNLSTSYQNYTVTRGHILYVNPDAEGKVYDKVYDFNEKDELFLKKLASAVYRQVKTLDFVENPELFLAADANHSVSDIRKFAEGLI